MFRVPTNAESPTFDDTFKVGVVRWLLSKKPERAEWVRRRNAATKRAEASQLEGIARLRQESELRTQRLRQERDARRE